MRLNRGTISLLAVLLVVIVAVLVINNQQLSAPGDATPTSAAVTGPLLPNVAAENIVRYEMRDNNTGDFTALTKDADGAWVLDSTNALADRVPEQSLIDTTAGQIVTINYANSFEDSNLPTFGLDSPDYTIFVTTSDGQLYTVYIGDKQPTSPRYYTIVVQSAAPDAAATAEADAQATTDATIEATAEATANASADQIDNPRIVLEGTHTIYLIPQTTIDTLKRWLTTPPYAPMPTAEPTLAVTPEATAEATAEATSEATPEATSETTAEATAAS